LSLNITKYITKIYVKVVGSRLAQAGHKALLLEAGGYLDKIYNRGEPKINFTLLFFPTTKEQIEEHGPAWSGVKTLQGNVNMFPRAPEGGWGQCCQRAEISAAKRKSGPIKISAAGTICGRIFGRLF
jgi:hypothetical protein